MVRKISRNNQPVDVIIESEENNKYEALSPRARRAGRILPAGTPGPRYLSPSVDREGQRPRGKATPRRIIQSSPAPRRKARQAAATATRTIPATDADELGLVVFGEGMEMMEEAPADLRELVRLPDVLMVCSSSGWTDQKHMLYLSLLEESFISQLHDGEISLKGLFSCSPRASRTKQSSKGSVKSTEADQGCPGVVEVDRAKSWIKVEQIESISCENQEDEKVHSMDDNASTTEPVQEASSHARATSSGQSSTCHFGKRRHSPSRNAEGSDQNFTDEETKGIGESGRRCRKKRLKYADDTMDYQVVPSVKAELQQASCLNARERHR